MEKIFFEIEKDGFYGTYYINPKESCCAMIGLFGDDPNDYMAKCGAKWLHDKVLMFFVCLQVRKTIVMSIVL